MPRSTPGPRAARARALARGIEKRSSCEEVTPGRAYVTFPTREQAERFAWLGGANTLPHGRLRGNFFGATSSKRGPEARLLG